MSELQLSDELLEKMQQTLVQFDDRAVDPGVAVQYYAAIMGYVVGQQSVPYNEKAEYLNQLMGFSHHVFEDVAQSEAPEPQAEPACGIWKPRDD